MSKDKNLLMIGGGVLIIFLTVAILSMLVLRKSNRSPYQTNQGNSYSTPAANQYEENELNVLLSPQNNSLESGTANIKDNGGIVTVTLNLTGSTSKVPQPSHIHMGVCPGVGAVKYPLNSVVNGESVTVLEASLMQLKQQLPLAINVHKSVTDISTYTSCGSL